MSKNYMKVKTYYDNKLWNIDRVRAAVGKWITPAEFKQITGVDYIS